MKNSTAEKPSTTTTAKPAAKRSKRKPLTDAEREQRAAEQRARLEQAVDALRTSEGWTKWLVARRTLRTYSVSNQLLIGLQRPDATHVAGYGAWQKLGYQVRKGERGIRINGPVIVKDTDQATGETRKKMVGVRTVSVFDVTQCDAGEDAKPLTPPASEPITGDSHAHLLPALEALAAEVGFTVERRDLTDHAAGGWCDHARKLIVIDSSEPANTQVATVAHEIAHACGATYAAFGRCDAEVIVESATFCALDALGLDTSGRTISYIAGWGEASDMDALREHAELIDTLAKRIERACATTDEHEAVAA